VQLQKRLILKRKKERPAFFQKRLRVEKKAGDDALTDKKRKRARCQRLLLSCGEKTASALWAIEKAEFCEPEKGQAPRKAASPGATLCCTNKKRKKSFGPAKTGKLGRITLLSDLLDKVGTGNKRRACAQNALSRILMNAHEEKPMSPRKRGHPWMESYPALGRVFRAKKGFIP